jgi:HSP20 family protein
MPLVPYDPFGAFRREFPGLFRFFDDDWPRAAAPVRVDVHETPAEVIVEAEIPGLDKKEDINIVVHDNHLHLSGTIQRTSAYNEQNVHRTERFYGQFSRTIPLPATVDEASAKATYRNGILEVRMTKNKKHIGQRVDVEFH